MKMNAVSSRARDCVHCSSPMLAVLVISAFLCSAAQAGVIIENKPNPEKGTPSELRGSANVGGQAPKSAGAGGIAAATVLVKVDVKDVRYIHTDTPSSNPQSPGGLFGTPQALIPTNIKLSATASVLTPGAAMTPAQFTFSVDGVEVGTVDSPDGKSAELTFKLDRSYTSDYVIRVVWKSKGNPPLPSSQGVGKLKYAGP